MLTTAPTSEMFEEWKQIFEKYHSSLIPNRKSGIEVDLYFRKKYSHQLFDNSEFREIVSLNITDNHYYRRKLPENTLPDIQCYKTGTVLVGIDLFTGDFHSESENTEEVIQIYNDLFVYRGLDVEDINNIFLVAEYVKLSQK